MPSSQISILSKLWLLATTKASSGVVDSGTLKCFAVAKVLGSFGRVSTHHSSSLLRITTNSQTELKSSPCSASLCFTLNIVSDDAAFFQPFHISDSLQLLFQDIDHPLLLRPAVVP